MSSKIWPGAARFAFTIFDDTDNATIENCKPVYDYLEKKGIFTTKSVWCYPPRGSFKGQSLRDKDYLAWIKGLQVAGFEIGLHNVGDGIFSREEIESGLKFFEETLGGMPKTHANHVSNPDNLYWWDRRFAWPVSGLYRVAYYLKRRTGVPQGGDTEQSPFFWGDLAKRRIKYIRNLTFSEINTLSRDPLMPWHDPGKPYANYWFSSSDGHNLALFNKLASRENLDKLEAQGGACIVYTHFASGFVTDDGQLHPDFKARIDDIASRNGWFVPCGEMLDYLLSQKKEKDVTYWYRLSRNIVWMIERIKKAIKYRM